jgi:hypothetical protein
MDNQRNKSKSLKKLQDALKKKNLFLTDLEKPLSDSN